MVMKFKVSKVLVSVNRVNVNKSQCLLKHLNLNIDATFAVFYRETTKEIKNILPWILR